MTRTKNAQASKPSIRPLVAPVPVHLEVARMAFLIAATITLLVLVDLAHSYCVEGHGLHPAAALALAVVTFAATMLGLHQIKRLSRALADLAEKV